MWRALNAALGFKFHLLGEGGIIDHSSVYLEGDEFRSHALCSKCLARDMRVNGEMGTQEAGLGTLGRH